MTDAKAKLTDLVRRPEAGDEVILTRHGHATVRLAPIGRLEDRPSMTREERLALIDRICASARKHVKPGPDAARSQDFLYDGDGLPRDRCRYLGLDGHFVERS